MKFNIKIRKYLILSALSLLLIISLLALANTLIRKPGVQQYILKKVCVCYGLDTKTGKMDLNILGTPGVVVHDVETSVKNKNCTLHATSVTINFSGRRLLSGELIPVSVDVNHPVINISETYVRSLLNKKGADKHRMPIFCRDGVKKFNIKDGKLIITGPSGIVINNLSAVLGHVAGTSSTYKISCGGRIGYKGEQSEFNTESTIDVNPDDVLKSVFSASIKTVNTPLNWIPVPAKIITVKKGLFSSNLNVTGSPPKGILLGGSVNFKSAVFTMIHKEQSNKYNVPLLKCNLDASIKDSTIRLTSLNMKNRDLDLDVNMMLDLTNRKNPDFKLTAKSKFMSIDIFRRNFPFQITKPWLEDELFPMFEGGMVRMDKLILDGTIDQFRHIKDKKNRSILGMFLTCKSFIVSNMGIQVPFTGVSASVDIKDGNLKVSHLSGVFGDSEIKEGSLDVEGMIGGDPVFTVFVDGDFDIRELMSQRELYVIPERARKRIEKFKGLDGRLSARVTIGYQKGWEAPRILNGDIFFRDTLCHKSPLDLPLRFSQIDFHFSEDSENTFSGQGILGNTQFNINGNMEISESELVFKHAEIKAEAVMNQLIESCSGLENFPFKFKGSLPLDITLDEQDGGYKYTGRIDTEKLVMESDRYVFHTAVKGNSVSFDIKQHSNGKLDLNNVRFKLGNSIVFLSGEYDLTDKKINALKITTQDLSIGDLGIQFKGTKNVLFGKLKGSLDFSFLEKGLKGMQVTGNLIGDKISFIPGVLPLPVSDCSFRLDLSGKNGFINQWDMKFGEYPMHLKGILHGWDKIKGDLLATADYIDLTELVLDNRKASADKSTSQRKAHFKTPDFSLKLNASKGIWRKLEFKRLNADMNFSGKNIIIKNAQAELETGDVNLSGTIGRTAPRKINLKARVKLDNQPIDKLISDTGFGDKGVKGTLSVKSSIILEGNADDGILKTLSGNIDNMVITKGLLKNSRVFIKILAALNIPAKFKERPPEMREEGFYFESLEGTAVIKKGILKTDGFVLKSPAFNAVGSGEENLYKQTHNIRLLVQPLTNIDFIIKHIPIVGRILVEGNETFFTVGYDVTGTWSKPELDVAPIENVKGLLGVFKRALLTPYKIIEDISNAAKSMKKIEPEVLDGKESTEAAKP